MDIVEKYTQIVAQDQTRYPGSEAAFLLHHATSDQMFSNPILRDPPDRPHFWFYPDLNTPEPNF